MAYNSFEIFSYIQISSFLTNTIAISSKNYYNCVIFQSVKSFLLNNLSESMFFLQIILLSVNNQIGKY